MFPENCFIAYTRNPVASIGGRGFTTEARRARRKRSSFLEGVGDVTGHGFRGIDFDFDYEGRQRFGESAEVEPAAVR